MTQGYCMVVSGPAPRTEEVELVSVTALEVYVSWGASVLSVAHLNPPRAFYVGEGTAAGERCDFCVPRALLGMGRLPIVLGVPGDLWLVIPNGASGTLEVPGVEARALESLRAVATPLPEYPGACMVPLAEGARARVELSGFVFEVGSVRAGRPSGRGLWAMDWTHAPYFGASVAVHAGFMAMLAFFTPRLGLADDEALERDRLYVMQQLLESAAEREQEQRESVGKESDSEPGGRDGARAEGAEGRMGKPTAPVAKRRWAIRGTAAPEEVQLSREAARKEAEEFGMIGLLSALAGDPNTPTAPWGRDRALGADSLSAIGNLFGQDLGEAFGTGGLALSGPGQGGGGKGHAIGISDIGDGLGAGPGRGPGWGRGTGFSGRGTHRTSVPRVRVGSTQVSGRLPPEVIQRIVRQNFGRFRNCYEQGLSRNPNLEGRIAVRFVIGRDGAVSSAANGGSDLPDSAVTSCVITNFYGLSFPAPEGGIVTVVYPIMLSPG